MSVSLSVRDPSLPGHSLFLWMLETWVWQRHRGVGAQDPGVLTPRGGPRVCLWWGVHTYYNICKFEIDPIRFDAWYLIYYYSFYMHCRILQILLEMVRKVKVLPITKHSEKPWSGEELPQSQVACGRDSCYTTTLNEILYFKGH